MRLALPLLMLCGCPAPAADSEAPVPRCDAFGEPQARGTVADDDLDEISGVVASRRNPGVLWVQVDSGGPAVVTALGEDGATRGAVTLSGVENRDWEDLALGPCGDDTCLFVGEIGDNDARYASISVLRFPEPVVTDGLAITVTPEVFEATYASGPVNAEALVVTADGLPAILTKVDGGVASIHAFPSLDTPVVLTRLGEVRVGTSAAETGATALLTGADLLPDGSRLALRAYGHVTVLTLPDGLGSASAAPRIEATPGAELQGEAVAFAADGQGLWHVAEGRNPTLWFLPCAGP